MTAHAFVSRPSIVNHVLIYRDQGFVIIQIIVISIVRYNKASVRIRDCSEYQLKFYFLT